MTQTVWVSPSAVNYSCLCEPCLDAARRGGALFSDALADASVRGALGRDAEGAVVHCRAGHAIELRRVERPPSLARPDERQLQLT